MKRFKFLFIAVAVLGLTACSDDDDGPSVAVLESFTIDLSTENEVPAVPGRSETGTAQIDILENNTLRFTITVNNLDGDDTLTAAHIHTGDLVSTGGIIVGLVNGTDISFNGNRASGTVEVTDAEIASIQGADVYVNVHSQNVPAGLVRGQVDKTIEFARNVFISPANEVPAVTGRNESGFAYLRLDSDNNLYYRVVVNNLDPTDAITMGHIHLGAADENGDVAINLGITSANLDTSLNLALSTLEANSLTTPTYVNIHSQQVTSGLLRGQVTE